jgi:hypothetical protein
MVIQAVVFGVGTVLVLATPLQAMAMQLMPVVVIGSSVVSLPISWMLAPRLQNRYWRSLNRNSDFISGPGQSTAH